MSNNKFTPDNRSTIENVSDADHARMEHLFGEILKLVAEDDPGIVASVLGQLLYNSIPGENALTDEQSLHRMQAVVALLNIMRDGRKAENEQRERTYRAPKVDVMRAVEDLMAIVTVGDRATMLPALLNCLMAAIANGRRNEAAEEAFSDAMINCCNAFKSEIESSGT